MAKKKRFGSVKRFGSRYGRTIRERTSVIEQAKFSKHKCPYCEAIRVKRASLGVYECTKCLKRFTGKAYSPSEEIRTRLEQAVPAAPKEAEEDEEEVEDA